MQEIEALLTKSLTNAGASYVDDVFAVTQYNGNGNARSLVNKVDLQTYGGMYWTAAMTNSFDSSVVDTVRGAGNRMATQTVDANSTGGITSFNPDGVSIPGNNYHNAIGTQYVSWAFRKAARFFDIVTYVGDNASTVITKNHNLGIAPGMIIIKCYSFAGEDWVVYHKNMTAGYTSTLNSMGGQSSMGLTVTASASSFTFTLSDPAVVNGFNLSYVVYLFADDSATDGIIRCGSFTSDASGTATVSLGWQPQYLLINNLSVPDGWRIVDTTRGWNVSSPDSVLKANSTSSYDLADNYINQSYPTPDGFYFSNPFNVSATYIYMAIRIPNKPISAGTDVLAINAGLVSVSKSGLNMNNGTRSPIDLIIHCGSKTSPTTPAWIWGDSLRGLGYTNSETAFILNSSSPTATQQKRQTDPFMYFDVNNNQILVSPSADSMTYRFARSPGVFDIVTYSGLAAQSTIKHNLGVAPEMIIIKNIENGNPWTIYHSGMGTTFYLSFDSAIQTFDVNVFPAIVPTSTTFTVGSSNNVNRASNQFIAYLFATKSGISKVGSYTGTASTLNIDCGFSAGARFILVKNITGSTADWRLYDSTRGIVSGLPDPSLFPGTTGAQTSNDDITPLASGFSVNASSNINVSGVTYIYLAIA